MGKIFYVMGKSSSGKDTIFQMIREQLPELHTIVLYTTRPIRDGEKNGETYHYTDETGLQRLQDENRVIELRAYDTVHGIWKYFTADDDQIDLQQFHYLVIGTLESYEKMREYFGKEYLVPIYIEVEDGARLMRALKREQQQPRPRYAELCRRFLADTEDFSETNLQQAGITKRYQNQDLETCLNEIILGIRSELCYN